MNNKKVIKEMFDKQLSIDIVHNNIIKKVEKRKKYTSKKLILIPTAVFLLGFVSLYLFLPKEQLEYQQDETKNKGDIIKINVLKDNTRYQEIFDVDGRGVEKNKEELATIFPFLNYLKVPSVMDDVTMTEEYASSDPTLLEFYNKLIGYHIIYYEDDYDNIETDKFISIFFSKTNEKRARCIPITLDDLEESIINEVPVKISKYLDEFIVLFKYQDLYFDIETKSITEEELIELVRSITKEV